jgi:hypothetical protein
VPGVRRLVRRHRGIRLREVAYPEEWNAAVKSLGGSIADEHDHRLFQAGEGVGMLRLSPLLLLVVGSWIALFLLLNHVTDI